MMSLSNLKRTPLNDRRSLTSSRDAIRRISSDGRSDNVGIVLSTTEIVSKTQPLWGSCMAADVDVVVSTEPYSHLLSSMTSKAPRD